MLDKPNPSPDCSLCKDTGWVAYQIDGMRRVKRCVCKTRQTAAADRQAPGGFVRADQATQGIRELPLPDLAHAALMPGDRQIAALISQRRGKAQAIRIREICARLWPQAASDLANFDGLARAVKAAVERLRKLGRLPIAATKEPPYGYFLPATAEECDEVHDRLFAEGIKLIVHSQLFRPDRDLVERLRGQLELESEVRSQESI